MIVINNKLDYSTHPKDTITLFTGNAYITKDGSLVMGRGAAKEVATLYPSAPKLFGKKVKEMKDDEDVYGVAWCMIDKQIIGCFQVKYHFRSEATLYLIANSALDLKKVAGATPNKTFRMNYPGIGWGHLDHHAIEPIVEILPDNVHLYKI